MMIINPNTRYTHRVSINLEKSKSRGNMQGWITFQAFLYKSLNMYKLFQTPYFSPQAEAQLKNIPFKSNSLAFKPEQKKILGHSSIHEYFIHCSDKQRILKQNSLSNIV